MAAVWQAAAAVHAAEAELECRSYMGGAATMVEEFAVISAPHYWGWGHMNMQVVHDDVVWEHHQ